jgi:hypothetical protein
MSKDDLHTFASDSTPQSVEIPKTYAGLLVWAVGKWGIGILFAVFLVPVYQDLKASNQRVADVIQSTVQVLTSLSEKVEKGNQDIHRLDDAVRRIESNQKP